MFKSVLWDFIGKFSNQVFAFVVSVILARLLLPAEFGLVGIVLVFATFSGVLFDFGFRNAIINQQEVSQTALSTIFYINLVVALVIAAIFFLASGTIAGFYREPLLEQVLKMATILFVVNAVAIVPTAINQKNLKFRANALITTLSTIVSGIISIWMAYRGWGVWSILYKSILQSLIQCGLGWFICRWRPSLQFRGSSVKPMVAYSSTIFLTAVLDAVFQRMDVLVIGRMYNANTLGYYTRAQTLESVPRDLTSGIVYSVFFPYFSKIKDNIDEVRRLYLKCLHVVAFSLLLLNGALFLNARQVIVILFTDKWLASVMYFKFFLVLGFFFTINVVMAISVASTGKYKLFLRSELFRKAILLPAYVLGFMGNIQLFLLLLIAGNIAMIYLNMVYTNKVMNLPPRRQAVVVLRYLLPAAATIGGCWFFFDQRISHPVVHLVTVSLVYTILLLLLNGLLKNPGLQVLSSKIPPRFLPARFRSYNS